MTLQNPGQNRKAFTRAESMVECECTHQIHEARFIAITGGPGAGKTALLEIARRHFCEHVVELPEAATVIFGGGFWRHTSIPGRKAAQRGIFHIQRELEKIVVEEKEAAVALCDRGTIDGQAYWPDEDTSTYWKELGVSRTEELKRYSAVIHLHPPKDGKGYNHSNPLRLENYREAHEIDEKIYKAWDGHPKRHFIPSEADFMDKVKKAIELIEGEVPACCKIKKSST